MLMMYSVSVNNVYICMYVYNQNDTSGAKSRAMRFVRVGHVTNKLKKKKKKKGQHSVNLYKIFF